MYVFTIIGKKRSGKSVLTREIAHRFADLYSGKMYFFDIANEYELKFGLKNNYKNALDHKTFLDVVAPLKNSFIVFEEAAYYFDSQTSKDIRQKAAKMLQMSRHNNNVIVLIFHSIADLPSFIYSRIDYLALFKTNDTPRALGKLSLNEDFVSVYESVRENPDKHYFEVLDVT